MVVEKEEAKAAAEKGVAKAVALMVRMGVLVGAAAVDVAMRVDAVRRQACRSAPQSVRERMSYFPR